MTQPARAIDLERATLPRLILRNAARIPRRPAIREKDRGI